MSNGITPLTPEETAAQQAIIAKNGYLKRVLVEADVLGNVVIGGKPDESISSRLARAAAKGNKVGIVLTKFFNLFESNHGVKSQAGDVQRASEVIKLENESGSINHSNN